VLVLVSVLLLMLMQKMLLTLMLMLTLMLVVQVAKWGSPRVLESELKAKSSNIRQLGRLSYHYVLHTLFKNQQAFT
jgi:hypothetical protein